ncbi:MAG: amidohydrolase [Elusimicrobia bacterium]|nr:amidohydrolase [Elusimicrobiota bacterium]
MPAEPADLVLVNGRLYRGGASSPGGVAVRGELIVQVGPDAEVRGRCGPGTRILDLRGGLVLPGWRDSHAHSSFAGLFRRDCDLSGLVREKDCLEAVARHARATPAAPCLVGGGWLQSSFGPQGPDRRALDAAVNDRPALLLAADGHAAWANSRALAAAGIRRGTPPPSGGVVEFDRETGEPTGTVREMTAILQVLGALPRQSEAEILAGAEGFLRGLAERGVVGLHDAALFPDVARAYRELDRRGALALCVDGSWLCDPRQGVGQLDRLRELRDAHCGDRFRPRAAKIFLDGVVEAHTALLLEPYADRPGERGRPLWEEPDFFAMVCALDRAGFQVQVHAIGDGAVRLALEGFARAAEANGTRDARHTIAHVELVSDEDLPRFRELGVLAVVQPQWFYKDAHSDRLLDVHLGPQRAAGRFRMRSLLQAGATVACGSDWPVGGDVISLDPLDSIQIGATRRAIDAGPDTPAYMPEERASLRDLIDGYTLRGAFAGLRERETGSIDVGKRADLTVLDRDICAAAPQEIGRAEVLWTIAAGRLVFAR